MVVSILPPPNDDNGYDVSDYLEVHPDFGTLDDFFELSKALKEAGIRLIIDMVLNHSSDEHAWFVESSKSKEGPYSNYYIWKDASGTDSQGHPIAPNNWTSIFGGSAWKWCESRQQFFCICSQLNSLILIGRIRKFVRNYSMWSTHGPREVSMVFDWT